MKTSNDATNLDTWSCWRFISWGPTSNLDYQAHPWKEELLKSRHGNGWIKYTFWKLTIVVKTSNYDKNLATWLYWRFPSPFLEDALSTFHLKNRNSIIKVIKTIDIQWHHFCKVTFLFMPLSWEVGCDTPGHQKLLWTSNQIAKQ